MMNHHHVLQVTRRINGEILWANLHLLFWFIAHSFYNKLGGKNCEATVPIAIYGVVLFRNAVAFRILEATLISCHDTNFPLRKLIVTDITKLSVFFYFISILSAFVSVWISIILYFAMACWWGLPSKQLEREVDKENNFLNSLEKLRTATTIAKQSATT